MGISPPLDKTPAGKEEAKGDGSSLMTEALSLSPAVLAAAVLKSGRRSWETRGTFSIPPELMEEFLWW